MGFSAILALVVLLLGTVCASAQPTSYSGFPDNRYVCVNNLYVSPTGLDTNNGLTPGSPLLTELGAETVILTHQSNGAGYCVRFLPGTYAASNLYAPHIGGASDSLTGYYVLVSDTPGAAIIQNSGHFNTIDLSWNGSALCASSTSLPACITNAPSCTGACFGQGTINYIVLDSFDIQGGRLNNNSGSGVFPGFDHHVKIINNKIHDAAAAGIQTQCVAYILMQNNIIYNNSWTGGQYSGISDLGPCPLSGDTDTGFHHVIERNTVFFNGSGFIVTANHTDGNGIILDSWNQKGYSASVLIDNNLVFNNGGRCIEPLNAFPNPGVGTPNGGMIRNNTCFSNLQDPYLVTATDCEIAVAASTGFTVVNNISVASQVATTSGLTNGVYAACDNGQTFVTSHNVWANNIFFGSGGGSNTGPAQFYVNNTTSVITGTFTLANPNFVAPSTNLSVMDFHVQAGSAALGAGTTAYGVDSYDVTGALRVVGGSIDIGAYQGAGTQTWKQAGVTDALVFSSQLYSNSTNGTLQDFLTNSGGGTTTTDMLYTSPAGYKYVVYPAGWARIAFNPPGAGAGLLVEPLTTNYLLNSRAPATQTTGSLPTNTYTLWINGQSGASATMSSGTATGCGTGVATPGTFINFTITVAGTCTVTVAGTIYAFQLEGNPSPTSFIPTAGATASRGVDGVKLTGGPQTTIQGTAASVAMILNGSAVTSGNINMLRATNNNFLYGFGATGINTGAQTGGVLSGTLGSGSTAGHTAIALGWNASGRSLVGNNGTLVTDSFFPSSGDTNIGLGNIASGTTAYYGSIAEYDDWNSRLPNATLQALSQR